MAVDRIDGIYLYTNINWTDQDNPKYADCKEVKKFLDDNNIRYIFLNYADPIQHEETLKPLRNWDFKDGRHSLQADAFPFVIYSEVDNDSHMHYWNRVILIGKDAILNSNLVELHGLGR